MTGAFKTVRDVTEQRRVERELRTAHERFRLAQKALRAGIWEKDLVSGEGHWSPELYELIGVEPSAPPTRHSTWSTSDTASVADTVNGTEGVVYQVALAVVEVSVGGVVSPEMATVTGMARQPEVLPAWSHTRV